MKSITATQPFFPHEKHNELPPEENIELFGDGSQARDFTYVDDIANGTILAAKDVGFEVMNLGGGKNPVTLNTVIGKIEKHLGKKAVYQHEDFHKTDIRATWADISKAEKILGWTPKVNLEAGLEETLRWHTDNKAWLSKIKL